MADNNILAEAFRSILQSRQGQPNPIQGISAGTLGGQAQRPPSILPQSVPQVPVSKGTPPRDQGTSNLPEILKFLIPALTAGVGVGLPSTLPGAAGFQKGFVGETSKEKETTEKDFIIIDPETGEQQNFKVPTKALVQQKRTSANVFEQLGIDPTQLQIKGTEKIKEEVKKKFLAPKGAPSAGGEDDGAKLKDDSGKVVAVAKDGKWVSP